MNSVNLEPMSDLGRLLSGPDAKQNLQTLVQHLEQAEAEVKRAMNRPSTKQEFDALTQKQKALHHGQAVLKSIEIFHNV